MKASQQIGQQCRALELQILADIEASRIQYRTIVNAVGNFDVTTANPVISSYYRLKSDARLLLSFYLHYVSPKQHLPDGRSMSSEELIEFELKYQHKVENLPHDEQLVQLIQMQAYRDSLMFRTCTAIIGKLGHDYLMPEQEDKLGSLEIHGLTELFRVFIAMVKTIKQIELTKHDQDVALELATMQSMINQHQVDLSVKIIQISELQSQLQVMATETGRQQAMSRQQDAIESLELTVRDLKKQLETTYDQLQGETQYRSELSDHLAVKCSQLTALRTAYEKDVLKMEPVLEHHLWRATGHEEAMRLLQNEVGLNNGRIISAEKKANDLAKVVEKLKTEVQGLNSDKLLLRATIQKYEAEVGRQSRMKFVAVAAKLSFQESVRQLESELAKALAVQSALKARVAELTSDAEELEAYVGQLQDIVEQAELRNKEAAKKLTAHLAESLAQELLIQRMREEMNKLLVTGMTDEKLAEWDVRELVLRQTQEQNSRLQNQLKTTLHRVYELQSQLHSTDTDEIAPA